MTRGKNEGRVYLMLLRFTFPGYEANITHTSWQMHIAIKAHTKMKWIEHSRDEENNMRTWETQSLASVNRYAA